MPGQQRPLSGSGSEFFGMDSHSIARWRVTSPLFWYLSCWHRSGFPFAAGVADRSDGLFFADRTGDGRDLRRRSQPVRLLGLSARRFGADLPFRSWGGACECQLGRSSAADFNHAGLCRGDDLELPVDFTAFPGRTRSPAGPDCPDGCDAADRRLDFSGDPGWRDGRHGECQQGLFQLEHVPEPRCDEPRFSFLSSVGDNENYAEAYPFFEEERRKTLSKSCGATVPGPMPVRPDCCAATGRTSY